jgi:NRAMP (natural resistance-associated macrophage protein)-like metal ion transporter
MVMRVLSSRGRESAGRPSTVLQKLGPGLITGASDDDPSGIATYSQVGAQFGYGMLWTMLFSYPLMSGIQEISARIGRVTGQGIAANLRQYYPRWLLYSMVGPVVVANVINLGADIGAMAAAATLLLPGPVRLYSAGFGLLCLGLQVLVPYTSYVRYLKWLTIVLFAYVGTAFVVHIPWRVVAMAILWPPVSLSKDYFAALVAVLGTTISPYLFLWQASQEVEEVKTTVGEEALKKTPRQATQQLKRIRWDTYIGMAFSNAVAFFIILTAAVTLHLTGPTQVSTAAEAAKALEPVAGRLASLLFLLGIVGTGLLAVPVLAGSAAYGVGETFRWRSSLERKPEDAKKFYAVLSAVTISGILLTFLRLNPIKALFWAAIVNGVVAGPLMVVIMLMTSNPKVMGKFTLSWSLKLLGWIATVTMFLASIGMLAK